jgi:hypothetical protein
MGAPTPGVGKRAADAHHAKQVYRITIRGETVQLAPQNLAFAERAACRKQAGMPLEAFWSDESQIGLDSVQVLWWLARRAGGETGLLLDDALADFPTDLTVDEIKFEVVEPDESDPEA